MSDLIGEIYKITNTINGKCYIGQTIQGTKNRFTRHLYDCKKGSCSKLYNAINKYGKEYFEVEILITCKRNELDQYEIDFIKMYDSINNGYNILPGGSICSTPESVEYITNMLHDYFYNMSPSKRTEISNIRIDIWKDDNYRKKVLDKKFGNNGITSTEWAYNMHRAAKEKTLPNGIQYVKKNDEIIGYKAKVHYKIDDKRYKHSNVFASSTKSLEEKYQQALQSLEDLKELHHIVDRELPQFIYEYKEKGELIGYKVQYKDKEKNLHTKSFTIKTISLEEKLNLAKHCLELFKQGKYEEAMLIRAPGSKISITRAKAKKINENVDQTFDLSEQLPPHTKYSKKNGEIVGYEITIPNTGRKRKYFISQKLTMQEKLNLAKEYLIENNIM